MTITARYHFAVINTLGGKSMLLQKLSVGTVRTRLMEVDPDTYVVFMGGGEAAWSYYRVKGRDGTRLVQIELSEPDEDYGREVSGTTAGELLGQLDFYPDDCELVFGDRRPLAEISKALVFTLAPRQP